MKVTARIHTETGIIFKKCKVSHDGRHILLRKETKKQPVWKPEIGTMEIKRRLFGRTSYFVDLFPEAAQTWTVDYKQQGIEMPKWDKHQSHKYIEMKMVEKAGQEPKEPKSNTGLWVVAVLVIVSIIVNVILSGRVRIG